MSFLGQRSMTRRTFAVGSHIAGEYVAGAPTDSAFLGTRRPMPTRDVQILESGDRERDPRVLYTTTQMTLVRQGTGQQSDHVSPDSGVTFYEVIAFYEGTADTAQLAPGVNHFKYAALRLQEDDG